MLKISTALLLASLLVMPGTGYSSQLPREPGNPANAVPQNYQATYNRLQKALDSFDKYLAAQPQAPQAGTAPTFASELLLANCNRGRDLIKPNTLAGVRLELKRFQELKITGVTVAVCYPLLMPDFPDHDKYLQFYQQVAQEVHKRHMKLDVEVGAVFANSAFAVNLPPYHYNDANFSQYESAIKFMASTIIPAMEPDYMNIGSEPDTSAALTGIKEFNDPQKWTDYVNYVLNGLDRGRTKIAAGFGNWDEIDYIKSLATQTNLDCIDIHIYPFFSAPLLTNIVKATQLARQNGKCVIADEAWLYKIAAPAANNTSVNERVFKLDAYSFWAPLDQQFIAELVKLAKKENVEYISPFWSTYLFAYLAYNPAFEHQSYAQVSGQVLKAQTANMIANKFSSTGKYYRQLIHKNR